MIWTYVDMGKQQTQNDLCKPQTQLYTSLRCQDLVLHCCEETNEPKLNTSTRLWLGDPHDFINKQTNHSTNLRPWAHGQQPFGNDSECIPHPTCFAIDIRKGRVLFWNIIQGRTRLAFHPCTLVKKDGSPLKLTPKPKNGRTTDAPVRNKLWCNTMACEPQMFARFGRFPLFVYGESPLGFYDPPKFGCGFRNAFPPAAQRHINMINSFWPGPANKPTIGSMEVRHLQWESHGKVIFTKHRSWCGLDSVTNTINWNRTPFGWAIYTTFK